MGLLGNHRVYFKYEDETIEIKRNKETVKITRPKTTCIIETVDNEKLATGTVKLYHKDDNNKIVGREAAFRKAVRSIEDKDINKAIRTDFHNNLRHVN